MMAADSSGHPYQHLIELLTEKCLHKFFNVSKLGESKYDSLPFSIRVLLEAAVRNCDGFFVKEADVENILEWKNLQTNVEVPFCAARVLFQDFTGIPAMVDLAAMRNVVKKLGGNPKKVNPVCPADLVIDHSVQIDFSKCAMLNAPNPGGGVDGQRIAAKPVPPKVHVQKSNCKGQSSCSGPCSEGERSSNSGKFANQIENTPVLCPFHLQPVPEPETLIKSQETEFGRNKERLQFLKWCGHTFKNVRIIPPGDQVTHQMNLEYLSRVVFEKDAFVFPDSVVGTDSHMTMVNGLGILGWGVGGIETEAAMLGQPVTLTLPHVVGCRLVGCINSLATSIDVVLNITKHLRQIDLSGKFVEFFGSGVSQLSIGDRTTISNMCPEYGAVVSFFPVDSVTLKHLRQVGFDKQRLETIEEYLKAVKLLRDYHDSSKDPDYSQVIEINLSAIVPHVSGPKRPSDRVAITDMKRDFQKCLNEKVGFKGFQIAPEKQMDLISFSYEGTEYKLGHGSVVTAAIISCTNNCNPSVMLTAGLLAKKAVEAGLRVKPYIMTSLSPGSGMVTHYLNSSGVVPYLSQLGFEVVGYGCSTCIGNTASLTETVAKAIKEGNLISCGILSGNRNFEGRLCDCVRANYLASPPFVVAYALASTINLDFDKEPLGVNAHNENIYLSNIWPSREELHEVEEQIVVPSIFRKFGQKLVTGSKGWHSLDAPESELFPWDPKSTYIRCPSFFEKLTVEPALHSIENAHVLLFLGDNVNTDHISPAGSIARNSAAARYLTSKGLTPREFNSYGARRGNDAVMTRGTFANVKLMNKFIGKAAPKTIHLPSGQTLDVFDAADRYQKEGIPLIILAGKKYGSGSSRDWAVKGPYLLGIKAVVAESYEKIHKNHLVGIGIIPLQFLPGESAGTLGLTGKEQYSLSIPQELFPGMILDVKTSTGKNFKVNVLFDSDTEVTLYRHKGLLNYMARRML